ncbi:MAG: PIN-like domain-containing protein [Chitinophagaceae bacterium]
MKKKFPEYYRMTENELMEIWKNCIFIFDANILLSLYRYSERTKNGLLNLMRKFFERIWLPHQSALEYNRNRFEVIAEQEKAHNEFIEKIKKIKDDVHSNNALPFLTNPLESELISVLDKVQSEVNSSKERYSFYLKEDPVYNTLSEIFKDKISESYTVDREKEICKEGEERYKLEIPPGYKDAKTKSGDRMYGDLILWKQVIDKAKQEKKPILLITNDDKADWWWKLKDGKTIGPRYELVKEIRNEAGVEFHMYSSENFLSHGQEFWNEPVDQIAVGEIQAMKMTQLEEGKEKTLAELRALQFDRRRRLNTIEVVLKNLSDNIYELENKKQNLQLAGMSPGEIPNEIQNLMTRKARLHDERQLLIDEEKKLTLLSGDDVFLLSTRQKEF